MQVTQYLFITLSLYSKLPDAIRYVRPGTDERKEHVHEESVQEIEDSEEREVSEGEDEVVGDITI